MSCVGIPFYNTVLKEQKEKEVIRCRGRICKQPLHNSKETREYWKLQKAAVDHTVWLALEEAMDLSKHRLQSE